LLKFELLQTESFELFQLITENFDTISTKFIQ